MRARAMLRAELHAVTVVMGLLLGGVAPADTSSEVTALGYQTEHADLVAIAYTEDDVHRSDASAPATKVEYELEAVLRGDARERGRFVVVLGRDVAAGLDGAPRRHLLFLQRLDDAGSRYVPLAGVASVRPLPDDGPVARLPEIVLRYAAALDMPESLRDEALREELVVQMEDDDAGIAWSGATDLYRRGDLLEGLSRQHGARIVAAFERFEPKNSTKEMLALTVALSGHPRAAEVLADAVDSDDAHVIKGGLGDAAEVYFGEDLAEELAERLADAPPARRVALISVLGRVGREDVADSVLPFLRDADPAVRQEALHACGRIARNVRWVARRKRTHAARTSRPEPRVPVDEQVDEPAEPPRPGELPQPRDPARVTPMKTAPRTDEASRTWAGVRERLRVELSRAALRARSQNDTRASLWALAQLDDPAAYAFLRRLADESEDDVARRHAKSYLKRPGQSLSLR